MMTLLLVTYPAGKDYMGWVRSLVERGYAACVNIIPVRSIYFWEESIQTDEEVLLLIKSDRSLAARLKDVIAAEHPYEVPEIVELNPVDVNKPYLEWVSGATVGRRV